MFLGVTRSPREVPHKTGRASHKKNARVQAEGVDVCDGDLRRGATRPAMQRVRDEILDLPAL